MNYVIAGNYDQYKRFVKYHCEESPINYRYLDKEYQLVGVGSQQGDKVYITGEYWKNPCYDGDMLHCRFEQRDIHYSAPLTLAW
jgi:hypothetical protein